MTAESKSVPLLVLSDAPSVSSGLARISRELCQHISADPALTSRLRLATAGIGGPASLAFPWQQYTLTQLGPGMTPGELPAIWQDFSQGQRGVVMAIWNPSWLTWLAEEPFRSLNCDWWLYAPVDGNTPGGTLPALDTAILFQFDRVLAYTSYGARVIDKSADWHDGTTLHLPHGLNRKVWHPRPRNAARASFRARLTGDVTAVGIQPDTMLLATVATNSARKDWALAFQTLRALLDAGHSPVLWAHTDSPQGCWDIPALAADLGVLDRLILSSGVLPDDTLAWLYSAADCTLAIGSGEGYGFSAAESLACGVPVVHGVYAGGFEFIPLHFCVQPSAFRVEPNSGLLRPVFDPSGWRRAVEAAIEFRADAVLPERYYWDQCWPDWRRWLLTGLDELTSKENDQ